MINMAGRFTMPPSKWRLRQRRGKVNAEGPEEADQILRPADRYGGRAHRIFEHEIPADDPGEKFAHGGVGVCVGAARDGNHGREFAVAHAGEGASEPGDEERKDYGGSGVLMGGLRGECEKAGADHGADTQRDQIHRAEGALQLVGAALAFAHDPGDWFRCEDVQDIVSFISNRHLKLVAPHISCETGFSRDWGDFAGLRQKK